MNSRERVLTAVGRGLPDRVPVDFGANAGTLARLKKVMFHSCGAIVPLIDRLIALGVDILDPLQAAAKGMDSVLLKERFGKRICLHGGIDTQHLLPHGSPHEVRREVRRRMEIFGAGGGYILAPCHVLQTDVPTTNVLAMYDRKTNG